MCAGRGQDIAPGAAVQYTPPAASSALCHVKELLTHYTRLVTLETARRADSRSCLPRRDSSRGAWTGNFSREISPAPDTIPIWTSHAACPTSTRQAVGYFSPGIYTAAFLTAAIHRPKKYPPEKPLSGWIAIWIAPQQGRSTCASRPLPAWS